MSEFDSRDIARKVEEHFNHEVPMFQGAVLLHPIILKVLDVLKEEGFIDLVEHHVHKWVDATSEVVTSGEYCSECGEIRSPTDEAARQGEF